MGEPPYRRQLASYHRLLNSVARMCFIVLWRGWVRIMPAIQHRVVTCDLEDRLGLAIPVCHEHLGCRTRTLR